MKSICHCFAFLLVAQVLLAQDTIGKSEKVKKPFIPKYERTKGYCGWVEAGINIAPLEIRKGPPYYPFPSLRIFNGGRLSQRVSLGAEIGMGPLLANIKVRINILKKKVTPIIDFSTGYVQYTNDDYGINTQGWNFSPSAGIKVWACDRAAFTFRVGYYGIYTVAFPKEPFQLGWKYDNTIHVVAGVEF